MIVFILDIDLNLVYIVNVEKKSYSEPFCVTREFGNYSRNQVAKVALFSSLYYLSVNETKRLSN